tara:strand:- start:175 stop:480 length:306 start_codon:yes stop_codon:yes gene_type:complete
MADIHDQNRAKTPPDSDKNLPETVGYEGEILPRIPRPGALNSLTRVRRELSRVYRDARQGRLETSELGRYAYALNILSKIVEAESLEERLASIEQMLEGRK